MRESKVYFGFAISDSMFPSDCALRKSAITATEVRELAAAGKFTPCLNPSHVATIEAMRAKFGIDVAIPEKAPLVEVKLDDALVVMSVRGLPRLEGRHEYTEEEIGKAEFKFSIWKVIE